MQVFDICASLVMIKLSKFNYIIWRSQILSLKGSLVVENHIEDAQKPNQNIEKRKRKNFSGKIFS